MPKSLAIGFIALIIIIAIALFLFQNREGILEGQRGRIQGLPETPTRPGFIARPGIVPFGR